MACFALFDFSVLVLASLFNNVVKKPVLAKTEGYYLGVTDKALIIAYVDKNS